MKNIVERMLGQAVAQLAGTFGDIALPEVVVERTRARIHGDFASNVALTMAKAARRNPRDIAQALRERLPEEPLVERVEVAGAGFLNFFLAPRAYHALIEQILTQRENFGHSSIGRNQRVQVEFVSANPTGPLHVGHGRGAAYGAVVADLLSAVGFQVQREYYVNDAGRQMDILATSIWLRYLELCGAELRFPSNGYRGDYIWDIAATLHRNYGTALQRDIAELFLNLPPDAPTAEEAESTAPQGDKEAHIDGLISLARSLLAEDYRTVFDLGLNTILADIRDDLSHFGVEYQEWYSERSLVIRGKVTAIISRLRDAGHLYLQDGAWWFRATSFGDEKDRVVVRDNGQTTYFATDIAYHIDKFERGFERVINLWGADHHGYVPRLIAALTALGIDPQKLKVLLVQFALLYRNGVRVQMSTRSGEFVTLRELRKEVGRDVARFFYIQRAAEQHLDFDLDLAKTQSNDNPVYYCQYAHARVRSVFRALREKGGDWERTASYEHLHLLTEEHEQALLITLARYPEIIETAALNYAPHLLANYLRELAADFHTYYNAHAFLVADQNLRAARLALIEATRQILANGLQLLGVSAPDEM